MDLETIVEFLSTVNPFLIYITVFFIAYIENIFPPSPSDLVIAFAGSLAAVAKTTFLGTLIFATLGSASGFITMFWIGKWFGLRIFESGKIKFIPIEQIHKVERWFNKYGYIIIVINRFLAGTRAVVAFFAGMSNMKVKKTFSLSFVSALMWNLILVYGGYTLGKNWKKISEYLETYWTIVTTVIVIVLIFWFLVYLMTNEKKR